MKIAFLFFSLIFSTGIFAIPKATSTHLPLIKGLIKKDPEHETIVKVIASIGVYPDDTDANLFYYLPPFRVFNYERGSASMVAMADVIKNYDEGIRLMKEVKNPTDETTASINRILESSMKTKIDGFSYYEQQIERDKNELDYYNKELVKAMISGQQHVVVYLEKFIKEKKEEIEKKEAELKLEKSKIDEEKEKISKKYTRDMLHLIAHHLKITGASFDITKYGNGQEEEERMFNDLSNTLNEASNSYAGFLSMNIYAGFTKEELDSIYLYLSKMPHIKLTLLPAYNFKFVPLTATSLINDQPQQAYLFREAKGAGNYTGSTLVFDLTVAGARSLKMALDAFIVPIGIQSTIEMKQTPFEAKIDCEFNSILQGRARGDVIDGFIVFSNDVHNNVDVDGKTNNVCDVQVISGNEDSAEYAAFKELEKVYEEYGIKKAVMSDQEIADYQTKVNAQLDDMPEGSYGKKSWHDVFKQEGFFSALLFGLTKKSDIYWHTTKENFDKLTNLKIKKTIKSNLSKNVSLDWPLRICLSYDGHKNAYQRCTEEEKGFSKNMLNAAKTAAESDPCKKVNAAN